MVRRISISKFPQINFMVDEAAENYYGASFWNKFENGNWELELVKEIVHLLTPPPPVFPTHKKIKREQRFIDVGASTGVYSLVAASVGCKSILAFEPEVMQFSALTKNVRLNKTFNIEIYNKFVFSRVALFSRYSNHLKKTNLELFPINDLPFDHLQNIFKMDIEGGEFEIIKNKKFIQKLIKNKSIFFLSIHMGFFSDSYLHCIFCKLRFRLRYIHELIVLLRFVRKAQLIFYEGKRLAPFKLLFKDRIFRGSGFKHHVKLQF